MAILGSFSRTPKTSRPWRGGGCRPHLEQAQATALGGVGWVGPVRMGFWARRLDQPLRSAGEWGLQASRIGSHAHWSAGETKAP